MQMAKMTSKNQLTLPRAAVEALGHPTHFRVQVHDGVLLLWPAKLVCTADAAVAGGGHYGSAPRRGK
ncbi:MAG: Toxin-antitoxin system, antitoxin component, AbrB domain protein [Roseomonas sp.]|nr:Toxin-antitoxin system, antitoxin component, AbrB domain protein [Roseomonas sp.]